MIRVEGKVFRANHDGDFRVMLADKRYADAVLIFNDNVVDGDSSPVVVGAGSAVIRRSSARYENGGVLRAFGLPTGWSPNCGAFNVDAAGALEPFAARAIILEIERLVCILRQRGHTIRRLIYSCDASDPTRIGQSIFNVPTKVIDFIMLKLREVPTRVAADEEGKLSLERIHELNKQIVAVAWLHKKLHTKLSSRNDVVPHPKRPRESASTTNAHFVVKEQRLSAEHELIRGLFFVGLAQNGHAVYEKRSLAATSSFYFA